MSTVQPLASAKSQIFESMLWFLPDWAQNTVLVLIILAVLATWIVKLRNKVAHRRALRQAQAQPVPAAAQYDQGSGADYLGAYAPQRRPEDGTA
ncbi:hypothetical protein BN159_7091 [Streptomyces davaonensis JCM 4913]|uniref:Uncharacterized protein n=1 Tax=Streptomyces davaonensis (strain DSM 101723 / JCM 4913 / KCC S-0913 / 768) TaxID=1214101 RepID=K4RDI1_STRDJ|nr:hypothetical protein [Streptomyces davaonensis]CCK31470.1 hypothetical protein BN159_7091 [Streptomyces davaonensis JCM 4913]